jgi:hypothetical protein
VLTGNPQHLLLILIAWLLAFGFRSETDEVLIYGLGLLGSFVLFSALIRCEPWNARYRLAFFALRVALVGVVIPARLGHTAATALSVVLILAALPYALSNDLRPLLSSQLRPSHFSEIRSPAAFGGAPEKTFTSPICIETFRARTKILGVKWCAVAAETSESTTRWSSAADSSTARASD